MKSRRFWLPLFANLMGIGLLLFACGPVDTTLDSPLEPAGGSGITIPQEAEEIVSHVQQDLAEELNVTTDEVQVTAIEAVEWSDTSLGCPNQDLMYAQVITPGYRVILEVEGTEYVYHTGVDHFVRCETSGLDEEASHLIRTDPQAATLGVQAQLDLTELLGISLDDVTVVSVEAVEWPDSGLGCPEEGMMYLQMVTPGYRIVVAGEGQEYVYHTDHARAVRCDQYLPTDHKGPDDDSDRILPLAAELAWNASPLRIKRQCDSQEKVLDQRGGLMLMGAFTSYRSYARFSVPLDA